MFAQLSFTLILLFKAPFVFYKRYTVLPVTLLYGKDHEYVEWYNEHNEMDNSIYQLDEDYEKFIEDTPFAPRDPNEFLTYEIDAMPELDMLYSTGITDITNEAIDFPEPDNVRLREAPKYYTEAN